MRKLAGILERVDRSTGFGRCKHVISQMDLAEDMGPVLSAASTLVCDGPLKTTQGLKLQCFLFDSGLVLCRALSSNRLSLYKNPLPVGLLKITDLGTKVGRSNSFLPGSSANSIGTKHVFKVETDTENVTLVTFNEHNKKQWMLSLHRVIEEWHSAHVPVKEISHPDSPVRKIPAIKASLDIRGPKRRKLPRDQAQVVSTPQLPSHQTTRFLRSKGSICLNRSLSPESHRICTRSCTSLKYNHVN